MKEPETTDQHVDTSAGLSPARLQWLCQQEQIGRTLLLLFYLNRWAKARDRLLYADRQGLYEVKAAVLRQAYAAGAIAAVAYVDGIEDFSRSYTAQFAVESAADVFLDWLAETFDEGAPLGYDDSCFQAARRLYARIVGREARSRADAALLDGGRTREYIATRLQELVEQARATRSPIPASELAALFIVPADLLDIRGDWRLLTDGWHSWDKLDAGDARQLDPEGASLIAFHYSDGTASYAFHLPFRVAEAFLPAESVQVLRARGGSGREAGEYFGCAIGEEDGLQYPVAGLLRELGVDIASTCPHGLVEKGEYLDQMWLSARHWEELPLAGEDWDDEDEEGEIEARLDRAWAQCPVCGTEVEAAGLPRIAHWRENHPDREQVTVRYASWMLDISKVALKSSAIAPDSRGPSSDSGGNGTRFWKLETLEAASPRAAGEGKR